MENLELRLVAIRLSVKHHHLLEYSFYGILPLAVNGYIVFCSNIPAECDKELVEDKFMEQGNMKSLQLPKDPKTGGWKVSHPLVFKYFTDLALFRVMQLCHMIMKLTPSEQ